MAKSINILNGQSMLDVAIHEFGTLESIMDLAIVNSKSITDLLTPGNSFQLPISTTIDKEVAAYYAKHQIKPATAHTPQAIDEDQNYLLTENSEIITSEGGEGIIY